MAITLSNIRKSILVYWYQYHVETNLWPTYELASEEIECSKPTICYHIKILLKEGWMTKDETNTRGAVALSKYGESKLFEAALISVGKVQKEYTTKSDMLINKMSKKKS